MRHWRASRANLLAAAENAASKLELDPEPLAQNVGEAVRLMKAGAASVLDDLRRKR